MRRTWSLSLLIGILLAAALPAQDWRGRGRAHGVVLDPGGEPLSGAEVRLERTGAEDRSEGGGPEPVVTGEDGEWSFVLLAPGVWRVAVEAEGFQPAEGWVKVAEEGPGQRTTIRVRSLDEVSPVFAEGDPERSVRDWLAKGDAYLEEGRTAEARAEYEKALQTPGVLGAATRGEVLQTVARTFFLEGDVDAALRHLRAAVVQSPADDRARQLLTVLAEQTGRSEEVGRFLVRLEREPEAVADELEDLLKPQEERGGPELPDRPVVPPEPGRTGRFRTAFTEGSPLSGVDVFIERYGYDREELARLAPAALSATGADRLDGETFEFFVPEGYAEGDGWGLLVWVSPGIDGGLHAPALQAVLAEHRLLWAGANRSGNGRSVWDRVGLALDAAGAMADLYDLAPDRIYAGGYSGGGRIASTLAQLYPEVFRGGLSWFGCDYFRPVSVPDRPGAHWPASFREPPRRTLRTIRERSRFVLVTGELDFNRAQTRATAETMEEDEFERVTYLEIPGADHYGGLDAEWLDRSLAALDLPAGPK